jgi:hypothetical protein
VGFEMIQKIKPLLRWLEWIRPVYYLSVMVMFIAAVISIHNWTMGNVERKNVDVVDFYSNYLSTAKLMNEMDVDGPVIIGGPNAVTNSIIPSLTLKYVPFIFRVEAGSGQTGLWKSLVEDGLSPEERLALYRENHVEYLLFKGEAGWLTELQNQYPENISRIFRDQRFSLYRLTP